MDKVAIVILNWNGSAMMRRFLPSVVKYSEEDGGVVYVADNASTDDSMQMLKEHFPSVRTIQLQKNWGFAEGYNKALAQIDAEMFLLLNSDVEVTPHWLAPLLHFMEVHPEVAFCQPKMLSQKDKTSFEYAGACGGFLDKYGYPFCRGRIFESVEKDHAQYDDPMEILWASGACLLIRSADYRMAGGLDGRFFAHNEEIDLCWRLRLMGRGGYCVPGSAVYHVGGGTLPKGNPMKTYLNFRNNLTMLYKNLGSAELRRVMCVRWFLDYLAAFQMFILGRNVGDFKAVFRARRDFSRWRSDYADERRRIQNGRTVRPGSVTGIFNFSLLWKYYARGIRRFSDL